MVRNIQVENNMLRERVEELEQLNAQDTTRGGSEVGVGNEIIDELQRELERLSKENHRLERLLQHSRRQTTELLLSLSLTIMVTKAVTDKARRGGSQNHWETTEVSATYHQILTDVVKV
jgi:predicted RNase H-like nuclease (RuvC/YqgF family)